MIAIRIVGAHVAPWRIAIVIHLAGAEP